MMLASIIIINFNDIRWMKTCLDSLFREVGDDSEIIVVDNASTDGGPEFIEAHYPGVKIIRSKTNQGFAAACNQGARFGSGKYFVFLNPDTEVSPGWLDELIKPFEERSDVGLTTSKILLMSDPERINACGLNIHYSGLTFARGYAQNADQFIEQEYVPSIQGASFAIRADLWKKLGGFDGRHFVYYEETDLSWRTQLAGYECLLVPDSIVKHAYSSPPSLFSLYLSARNRLYTLLKNWKWSTILVLSPGIILAELVDLSYYLVLGKDALLSKMRAYYWLLKNLHHIIEQHRRNQMERVKSDLSILRDHRVYALSPVDVTGGSFGKIMLQAVNFFLHLFYAGSIAVLRLLKL